MQSEPPQAPTTISKEESHTLRHEDGETSSDQTNDNVDLEKAESQAQHAASKYQGQSQNEKGDLEEWDGPDDPQNPMNWKLSTKYTTTILYATMTFTLTFSSSVFSTATRATAQLFGVSNEVMVLGTSLFVLVSPHRQVVNSLLHPS